MINTLIDRFINRLTSTREAGACVPTAGDCCPYKAKYIVSCTGPCVSANVC